MVLVIFVYKVLSVCSRILACFPGIFVFSECFAHTIDTHFTGFYALATEPSKHLLFAELPFTSSVKHLKKLVIQNPIMKAY